MYKTVSQLAPIVFRRWVVLAPLFAALVFGAWFLGNRIVTWFAEDDALVKGIVWQVDMTTLHPEGNWDKLGVDSLLVQWSEVNGICFAACPTEQESVPDWVSIGRKPWAKNVILGLAGNFNERVARHEVSALAQASAEIARRPLPLNVVGYYFPVEVDPSWKEGPEVMGKALAKLPRPLWISVYEGYNIGGEALAEWLAGWLPDDVGILFQDGVGVEARSPAVAREYVEALAGKFGRDRLKVIVEAFRPLTPPNSPAPSFRAATAEELGPQIAAMHGYDIYLFDGPHYVSRELVRDLLK